ncbi:MAG: hypothetical protein QOD77_81 [Thermoplasmata archaeon]|nr:hypothetical protein [Thermoplasmata archaeon]
MNGARPLAVVLALLAAGCLGPAEPELRAVAIVADGSLAPGEHRVEAGARLVAEGTVPLTLAIPDGAVLELRDGRAEGGHGLVLRVEAGGTLLMHGVQASAVRVLLEPGASARIVDSTLGLGAGGIHARNASLALVGGLLHGSTEEWLRVEGGTATVAGTSFVDSGGGRPGIAATGADLRIADARLDGAKGYGIQAQGGLLRVERTTVASANDYGLQASGGRVELADNRWEAFCGVFLGPGATGRVERDLFVSAHRGLTLAQAGNVTVEGARFEGVQHGAQIHGGTARVANSTFARNDVALSLDADGNATVVGNRFTANGGALEVHAPSGVHVRGNGFEGSVRFAVANRGATPLDARGNWWGRASGPVLGPAAEVQGDVNADPWLEQPETGG